MVFKLSSMTCARIVIFFKNIKQNKKIIKKISTKKKTKKMKKIKIGKIRKKKKKK